MMVRPSYSYNCLDIKRYQIKPFTD